MQLTMNRSVESGLRYICSAVPMVSQSLSIPLLPVFSLIKKMFLLMMEVATTSCGVRLPVAFLTFPSHNKPSIVMCHVLILALPVLYW